MTTIPFKDSTPVLRLQNLNVKFAGSPVSVLDDISLTVRAGETLALVGESGCGKSITSLALMGLLPASARIVSGEMNFRRQDLRKLAAGVCRSARQRAGDDIPGAHDLAQPGLHAWRSAQ